MTRTVEAYVAAHGAACPVCGKTELDRAPATVLPEPRVGRLTVWVACEHCRTTWLETYALVDCSHLSDSEGRPIDFPATGMH